MVPEPELDRPVDLRRTEDLGLLLGGIDVAQRQAWDNSGLASLDAVSVDICRELADAGSFSEETGQRALLLAAFVTATFVAVRAYYVGDISRIHEWLLRAVVDDYHGDDDYEIHSERLLAWTAIVTPALREQAVDAALQWLTCLYAHSQRSGDHRELAREVFWALEEFVRADVASATSSPGQMVQALLMRAQWAVAFESRLAAQAVTPLLVLLGGEGIPVEDRAYIEAFLATTPVQFTERPQRELAGEALRAHAGIYDAATRLRLRIASCWGDAQCLRDAHAELLALVAESRRQDEEQVATPSERLLRRGSSFKAIEPALLAYALAGDIRLIVELLGAWSSEAAGEELVREPTVALTTHPVGTLWSVPGDSAPDNPTVEHPLAQFTEALNAFFGLNVLAREYGVLTARERVLFPNESAAVAYERAALTHLRLDAWTDLGLERLATNLVLTPGITLPVQPLLLRELDAAVAISVSLREPAPQRAVRRAALLGDNSFTSPIELDAVESRLTSAGVEVVRLPSTNEAFVAAYTDDSYDLIWVAAHGDYEAYELERSALVLGETEKLSINELAELPLPTGNRRALVLNLCSGGLSATLGGLLGLGLGPVLAGPAQTVVSHLWPTAPEYASAFGALYADALMTHEGHLDAYAAVVLLLLAGSDAVLQELSRLTDATEVTARFRNSSRDFNSILAWGSPVLLV